MNERINQLRLEAGISRLHDEPKFMVAVSKEGTVIEPLDGLEKFARLIVRECADIAKHHVMNISTYSDADFVEKQIQEHFGVEE